MVVVVIYPDTLTGWLGVTLVTLSIVAVLVRVLIWVGNTHIDSRINRLMGDLIETAMAPLDIHLEAIRLQLVAHGGELTRVRELEKTIENGLTHRQARIEEKMDRLLDYYAQWNGDERRG